MASNLAACLREEAQPCVAGGAADSIFGGQRPASCQPSSPSEVREAGRIWRLTMGDFLMPVPAPSALPQGLGHLQQQDPPQQLHQPHRDGAAAAGRGASTDGRALPGAQDQARALPAAAHLREGRHRRECALLCGMAAAAPAPLLPPARGRTDGQMEGGREGGAPLALGTIGPCWRPHCRAGEGRAEPMGREAQLPPSRLCKPLGVLRHPPGLCSSGSHLRSGPSLLLPAAPAQPPPRQ